MRRLVRVGYVRKYNVFSFWARDELKSYGALSWLQTAIVTDTVAF